MAYEKTNVWESADFKSLGEFIGKKSEELDGVFKSHTVENGQLKMTEAEAKEVRDRNDELGEATKRWEGLREMDSVFEKNRARLRESNTAIAPVPFQGGKGGGEQQQRAVKSAGELFTESTAFKSHIEQGHASMPQYVVDIKDIDVKTVMTTTAGYAAPNDRGPRVVPMAMRRPVVSDLIPTDSTSNSLIKYMEETTFTNNAATVAENAEKPESALAFTERQVAVQVIATTLPITDQQLDDVPGMRALVDNRLSMMVMLAEEVELLNGTGVAPRLLGFYNLPGIVTQAKGADPTPDAIYKAFTAIRYTGFAEPSGIVMHPNDWQDIRLLRTVDGIYIWGSPAEPGLETLWGKPVIVTPAATEGTALTGDFQLYSHISRKMGLTIAVGYVNADFRFNRQTIKCEMRESLEVYRVAAFHLISGI